jgi:small-conductance mechanosensitive channel/CRP-like cAMP-binding protein
MDKYLDFLADTSFAFGGIGTVIVTVLVVLLLLLMPREMRGKVRFPAALMLAYVALSLVHRHLKSPALHRPTELAGLAVLLLCFARSTFLLVFEWFFKHRLKRQAPRIVSDIVQVLIYFSIALIIFREMGAELGSLLTTSALITAVIGLSLQETLGNLFAGLAIQAQRPFEVGDWIQTAGSDESPARVTEINWRATKLLTNDNDEITVPNGLLAKSLIRNFSKPSPVSRRRVQVQGPYDMPPHRVEAALVRAAVGCAGVFDQPAPKVWLTRYADSGVEYTLLYWTSDFERRGDIDAEVQRRIWYALQRAAISIPFPVREVHIQQPNESALQANELEQSRLRLRLMKSVDFLAGLQQPALDQLAQTSRLCLYASGEEIVRQGEPGSELFIIKSGQAAVLIRQDKNEPVEITRLGPNAILGEMSLVTGTPRTATVRALSVCEVLVIGHDEFANVLVHYPDIAQRISDVLASRQAELDQAQESDEQVRQTRDSNELLGMIRRFFSL